MQTCYELANGTSIFIAELWAILMAVRNIPKSYFKKNTAIVSDSLLAVTVINEALKGNFKKENVKNLVSSGIIKTKIQTKLTPIRSHITDGEKSKGKSAATL